MGAHRPMKPRQVMPKIAGRKRMLMMDPSRVFSLFDHLVGTCEQRRRHFETERLGSLEIDHLAYPRSKGARSVIALTMALAWKPSSSGTSPALRWIQNVFSPPDAAPLMSQEFAEMNPSSGFVTFRRQILHPRFAGGNSGPRGTSSDGHNGRTDYRRYGQACQDQRNGTKYHVSQSANGNERNAD